MTLTDPSPSRVRGAAEAAIADLPGDAVSILARFGRAEAGALAILDSSFNPPTLGHAAMVRDLAERGVAHRALLLLAIQNADKAPSPAAFPDRLAMMAAVAGELAERIPCALGLTRAPLFIDKVRQLRARFGDEAPLHLIIGDDTLLRLFAPRYYDHSPARRDAAIAELTGLARLTSFRRQGVDPQFLAALFAGPAAPFIERIERRPMPLPGRRISSERARRELRRTGTCEALSPAVRALARAAYPRPQPG